MHYQLPKAAHIRNQPASYQQQLAIPVDLPNPPTHFTLKVSYQGCLGHQLCYPPTTNMLQLHNNQGHITWEKEPTKHAFLLKILSFFGLGLLLSMTPCVLPMLPVSCSLILGNKNKPSTVRALGLSLCYVLSMALTYATAGVLAASAGTTLQGQLQRPLILWGFAIVCGLMGISMLQDRWKLSLPQAWQQSLAKRLPGPATNPYLRVITMGILCTLMLSPCVSAPLITALSYISLHHAPWLGGSMLFSMGIGMGIPIIVINTIGRHYIPRNGTWTQVLQTMLGITMGGLGLWLLRTQLSTMWLWSLAGLWLGYGLWRLSSPWLNIAKRLASTSTVAILSAAGLWWHIGHPASIDGTNHMAAHDSPQHMVVTTPKGLELALQQHHNKAILIDFYADWCIACQELNKTLNHLSNLTQGMQIIQVDISPQNLESKTLQQAYHVYAPPSLILLKANDHTMVQRFDGKPSTTQLQTALEAFHKLG